MKGAGLTVGGFYAHFASKGSALIDEAPRRTATELRERLFARLDDKPQADRAESHLEALSVAGAPRFADRGLSAAGGRRPRSAPPRPSTPRSCASRLTRSPTGSSANRRRRGRSSRRRLALGLVALHVRRPQPVAYALKGTELSDEVLKACRALGVFAARGRARSRRSTMNTSYILDAARTPRGRGKAGKGALSSCIPRSCRRRRGARSSPAAASMPPTSTTSSSAASRRRRAGREHRAQRGARRRLAERGQAARRSIASAASGLQAVNFAAMGVMSGVPGPRRRRRRREHVARAHGLRRRRHRRQQHAPSQALLPGPARHQRRLHRDAAKDSPRRRRRVGRAIAAARRARARGEALRAIARSRSRTTSGKLAPRQGREPAPRHDDRRRSASCSPRSSRWARRPSARTARRSTRSRSRYPQASAIHHVHTAGNSSGIVDGAAAVAVASERLGARSTA